jgi:transcriptional regulator NrdR family protein
VGVYVIGRASRKRLASTEAMNKMVSKIEDEIVGEYIMEILYIKSLMISQYIYKRIEKTKNKELY